MASLQPTDREARSRLVGSGCALPARSQHALKLVFATCGATQGVRGIQGSTLAAGIVVRPCLLVGGAGHAEIRGSQQGCELFVLRHRVAAVQRGWSETF